MRKLILFTLLITASFSFVHDSVLAQTKLVTKPIKTGLDTPWEIIWGSDNWLWVTERMGRISRINPNTGEQKVLVAKVGGVSEISESGLMGMALHPNFKDTSWVYIAYTYQTGSSLKVRVERFTYRNDSLLSPLRIIDSITGNTTHDGCRLLVSPDRKLFITTGDAQNQPSAQNLKIFNGKTLRLNLDGSYPNDNPQPQSPVWTLGHRNAQGMVIAPDGTMFQSEHGPDNDDEINVIEKGRNYGWPTVQGFCDNALETQFCLDSNVKEPIQAWTPTLAVCGLDYYNSSLIPEWKNCLLLTTLKASYLAVLKLNGTKVASVTNYFTGAASFGRLRDLCVSPDGRVFIGTSNQDGRGKPKTGDDQIIEIKPEGTTGIDIDLPDLPKYIKLSVNN